MNVKFILNGDDVSIQAEAGESLAEILGSSFNSTSLHSDCTIGVCGKCIVLLDGLPVNSCLVPIFRAKGSEIVTYEGFSSTQDHVMVRKAFAQNNVELCAFCDAPISLVIGSMLDRAGRPSDAEITEALSAVMCRCTPPAAIIATVHTALAMKEGSLYRRAR